MRMMIKVIMMIDKSDSDRDDNDDVRDEYND